MGENCTREREKLVKCSARKSSSSNHVKYAIWVLVLSMVCAMSVGAAETPPTKPQPVFVQLFCHTEDHINVELSEERFFRILPLIEKCRKEYPQYNCTASFQFYGADSEVFAKHNVENQIVDFIKGFSERGVLELGYHAWHEPTYKNRPSYNVDPNASPEERWKFLADSAERFLTEHKHLFRGDPDPSRLGALKMTEKVFGPAQCVSGIGIQGTLMEPPITHVLDKLRPGCPVFGFGDHGPWGQKEYHRMVARFTKTMSPQPNCARELFWTDNRLAICDTDGVQTFTTSNTRGPEAVRKLLENIDRSQVHFVHIGMGTKFTYKKPRQKGAMGSPTRYAYAHPDNPKLPPEAVLSREEIEANYRKSEEILRYLVEDFFPKNPGSHFVSNADLLEMSQDRLPRKVSRAEVIPIARLLLNEVVSEGDVKRLPPYVFHKEHYYCLTELLQLFSEAVGAGEEFGKPPREIELTHVFGPIDSAEPVASAFSVSEKVIRKVSHEFAERFAPGHWEVLPSNIVPGKVDLGEGKQCNGGEILLALATFCAKEPAKRDGRVEIQPCRLMPITAEIIPFPEYVSFPGVCWTYKPGVLKY